MTFRFSLFGAGLLLLSTSAIQGALFVPSDLAAGSQYHLIFVTDGTTTALNDSIDLYDEFVNADVDDNADLKDINWLALGSTIDKDAAVHAAVKGPVYRLDGARVATKSTDLWDGTIENPVNVTPNGTTGVALNVWTGSGKNGKVTDCKDLGGGPWECALGKPDPEIQTYAGNTGGTDSTWFTGTELKWSRSLPMYAVSAVLTVPNTALPGDFDGNKVIDAHDIDLIGAAIRGSSTDTKFDVNKSGKVDAADGDYMIDKIVKTWVGDSNLDKKFNTDDLVAVFIVGEYEDNKVGNSTWAEGDWDLNGDFNTNDLVTAFVQGGYEAGPHAAVSAVPEPASGLLALLGMVALGAWRRK